MLTYDLQRYHPGFVISVVDQVLENVRRGLEVRIMYQDLFHSWLDRPFAAKSLQV
jgi:hypothetical protein